jgi:hypothetical protein
MAISSNPAKKRLGQIISTVFVFNDAPNWHHTDLWLLKSRNHPDADGLSRCLNLSQHLGCIA